MNHSYRLVWSNLRGALLPVPEFARRSGGRASSRLLGALILAGLSCGAYALPTGGQVISGTAAISQTGNILTVTNSANAILNWQKFGIAASETVKFLQPSASSAVLNRVLGSDPSLIYGQLLSNGKVWLINPNGILVGPTGRIDTASFVASTLDISNADFLAGRLQFEKGVMAPRSTVNQGVISTPSGGQIYLVGSKVRNEGTLITPNGETILAAGQSVQLVDTGTPGVSVEISGRGTATNLGSILAQAGRIGIAGMLVKNAGTLNANNVISEGGRIFLRASKGITLTDRSVIEADGATGGSVSIQTNNGNGQLAGTLKARGLISAQGDYSPGSGGSVETSAAKIDLNSLDVQTHGGTWLIDAVDFTIAAKHGDISGTALASELNGNNVTILTGSGDSAGAGDINLNSAVGWNSANSLILSALHEVKIKAPISNAGSGGVTLRADNTGACVAGTTDCGTVVFDGKGHVTVNGGPVNIYYNPAGSNAAADANGNGPSYATPTNYTGDVTLYGGSTLTSWMLVNDVNQLQSMATNLGGNYALGRDIDASATAGWNGGAGFAPVGYNLAPFSGKFGGGGHAISGLTINRPTTNWVGLFGGSSGSIADVHMVDVNIVGYNTVGALAGWAPGTVSDSSSSGSVSGNGSIGGLIGATDIGSLVTRSSSSASVTGTADISGANVGGLIGLLYQSSLSDSWASGNVSGARFVGGLVGINYLGNISSSHSTGMVSGTAQDVAGLVGVNSGTIANSYATGIVRSTDFVGGLVGDNTGTISKSYSTGAVTATDNYAGGLVATNEGMVSNSYSTGAISGQGGAGSFYVAGGLVGFNSGAIATSYSIGTVSGQGGFVGGLVGWAYGSVSSSYWDITTSGQITSAGGTGLTDSQMRQQNGFVGFDFANTWIMQNQGYPLLRE